MPATSLLGLEILTLTVRLLNVSVYRYHYIVGACMRMGETNISVDGSTVCGAANVENEYHVGYACNPGDHTAGREFYYD